MLARLAIIDLAVVISADGSTEKVDFINARKRTRELDVVVNFKKAFDTDKTETGMAFLIVYDMLLMGWVDSFYVAYGNGSKLINSNKKPMLTSEYGLFYLYHVVLFEVRNIGLLKRKQCITIALLNDMSKE